MQFKPGSIFEAASQTLFNEASSYEKIPAEDKFIEAATKKSKFKLDDLDRVQFTKDINRLKKMPIEKLAGKFLEADFTLGLPGRAGIHADLYSLYAAYFLIKQSGKIFYQTKEFTKKALEVFVPHTFSKKEILDWQEQSIHPSQRGK